MTPFNRTDGSPVTKQQLDHALLDMMANFSQFGAFDNGSTIRGDAEFYLVEESNFVYLGWRLEPEEKHLATVTYDQILAITGDIIDVRYGCECDFHSHSLADFVLQRHVNHPGHNRIVCRSCATTSLSTEDPCETISETVLPKDTEGAGLMRVDFKLSYRSAEEQRLYALGQNLSPKEAMNLGAAAGFGIPTQPPLISDLTEPNKQGALYDGLKSSLELSKAYDTGHKTSEQILADCAASGRALLEPVSCIVSSFAFPCPECGGFLTAEGKPVRGGIAYDCKACGKKGTHMVSPLPCGMELVLAAFGSLCEGKAMSALELAAMRVAAEEFALDRDDTNWLGTPMSFEDAVVALPAVKAEAEAWLAARAATLPPQPQPQPRYEPDCFAVNKG